MICDRNQLKKELKMWKQRKKFAVKNKDKEAIHLANNKITDIKLMLKERII
jgi:hypothetical protein